MTMTGGPVEEAGRARTAALIAVGIAVVALGARVSWTIPGTVVPQSGQTLAVLLVGAFLGMRRGGAALGCYLLAGGAGVPVFADGAAGWAHLVGPTSGYLVGFVVAAVLVGRASDRELLRRPGPALGLMLLGHAVILVLGWARLSWTTGAAEAYGAGVAPFVWGGVVKSVLAAGVAVAAARSGRLARP